MGANGSDAAELGAEAVKRLYARMAANIAVMRQRLGRPLTLGEKILFGHLDDAAGQEIGLGASDLILRPDRVAFHDAIGQTALLQFAETGRRRVAVPTTVHCDHLVEARSEGIADLAASLVENAEVYGFLRRAAAKYGAGFWHPGAGIMHQVVLETYAFPGALILGTDSHTPNAGGLGACGVGVGGAEAVEVIAGQPWTLPAPRRIAIYLEGALGGWTAPKDVILHLARRLKGAGATNAIIEYIGPGARALSATGKATIANMGAELGATSSVFPYDAAMARYLAATGRGELVPLAAAHADLLAPDPEVERAPERFYDRVMGVDLARLEPHIAGPHTPDRARPLSEIAAETRDAANGFVDALSVALIGSCTNASYEDMSRAADIARQARAQGIGASVPLMVTPGSEQVRATLERDGQLGLLTDIGATVLANACGPCIGQWRRDAEPGRVNTIVTSYNRNFRHDTDGQACTMHFIASPEIVTALALAGRLSFDPQCDSLRDADGKPFRLSPPAATAEIPERGFVRRSGYYDAPPEDGGEMTKAGAERHERGESTLERRTPERRIAAPARPR